MNTATHPASRNDEPWWRERDLAKRALCRRGGYPLVFLGDSVTQGWEEEGAEVWRRHYAPRDALNLGFSGDRTEHLLWRLEQSDYAATTPRAVVLMIGTNNTGHLMQAPGQIAEGVERVLQVIAEKTPETRVVLHALFPRGAEPDDAGRLNNAAVNRLIEPLADGRRVVYADIGATFLEPDGRIAEQVMPDGLHLSAEGYRRWAEALEPTLAAMGL